MGQKINPIGLRLQVNRTWESVWFAGRREFGELLHQDLQIRKYVKVNCSQAGISRVVIERPESLSERALLREAIELIGLESPWRLTAGPD